MLVRNWHALGWETEEQVAKRRSVDKRGAKSDEAYVREVLGELAAARDMLVINDEAHHAWRVPTESKVKGLSQGRHRGGHEVDRLRWTASTAPAASSPATTSAPRRLCHRASRVPRRPLFEWIVSDFGLNDAIESGLVKTPRVVVRDDGQYGPDYKSRLYHIYNDADVKDDLNRKAEEQEPLPDLVTNGYYLLGKDWLETAKKWEAAGHKTPPVMITVANRTETAARVKYAFDRGRIRIDELRSPERTLHIDSKVLEKAESQVEAAEINGQDGDERGGGVSEAPVRKLTKDQQAELLRRMVDTVGRARRARRPDSERHFRRHAFRRLGRQDRHPHHGAAGIHQPVALRAGGWPRVAADFLRSEPRKPGSSSRNTSTSSACRSPSCRTKGAMARRRLPRRRRRKSSRWPRSGGSRFPGRTSCASTTPTRPC